ncbi:glycosyltransferase family 4 protein [Ruania suaedae]|uniref:glycosyltransferase family 4 protein n=1 Tax=Ruania suaedae TaxID=2897774 RepID=UPI001E57D279|nr:glycosyltransferase family 4 protein [Ruania suaedae]UFU03789.1 glycosyltransferase family 4 protein [Ruania suaedae]
MRRVAYVCTDPGIPVFGRKGASAHVRAVLRRLVAAGWEVHLLAPRTGGPAPSDLAGVRWHRLPEVVGARGVERERSAQASDGAVPALLDRIAAEAPLDLVYERYALWGRSATSWALARGVPSLLEVNAPLVDEHDEHRGLVDRRQAESTARLALGRARAVVCVSESVARWARTHAGHIGHIHVIGNGVDTTRITPATHPPVAPDAARFTVGFVGTLKPWHGVEVLVDAMARLVPADPSYRLRLIGDGPLADDLHARAQEHGIDGSVELVGAVDPDEIGAQLRELDLAAAPYPPMRDCYFSPLKVREYLAAGLPVVASRIGVLPALLEHGRLGELVTPGDPTELAAAIAALRADRLRRTRLREAGVRAAARHDWARVVTESLELVGLRLPQPEVSRGIG